MCCAGWHARTGTSSAADLAIAGRRSKIRLPGTPPGYCARRSGLLHGPSHVPRRFPGVPTRRAAPMADVTSRAGSSYATEKVLAYVNRVHAAHDPALEDAFSAPERANMPAIQVGPSE